MWLKSFATITHSRAFILCRTSPIKFLTEKSLLRDFKGHDLSIRLKYVQHKGVKGIRNKKRAYESLSRDANEEKTSMTKDFGKGGNHDESINLNDRYVIQHTFVCGTILLYLRFINCILHINTLVTLKLFPFQSNLIIIFTCVCFIVHMRNWSKT